MQPLPSRSNAPTSIPSSALTTAPSFVSSSKPSLSPLTIILGGLFFLVGSAFYYCKLKEVSMLSRSDNPPVPELEMQLVHIENRDEENESYASLLLAPPRLELKSDIYCPVPELEMQALHEQIGYNENELTASLIRSPPLLDSRHI